jgi:hypothetical protein
MSDIVVSFRVGLRRDCDVDARRRRERNSTERTDFQNEATEPTEINGENAEGSRRRPAAGAGGDQTIVGTSSVRLLPLFVSTIV